MEYTELTSGQQYQVVQQRLLQIEQQHLLATVNAAAAEAAGEQEQFAALTNQATKWAASAAAVRDIMSGMEAPDEPERVRPLRREPAQRPSIRSKPRGSKAARVEAGAPVAAMPMSVTPADVPTVNTVFDL